MENKRIFITNVSSFKYICRDTKNKGNCGTTEIYDYKLETTVRKKASWTGAVVNAESLNKVVEKNIVNKLEKQGLDENIEVDETSESIIQWVWQELEPYMELVNCELYRVALWDTPTSKIEMLRNN